jgi:hypothetical protein
MKILPASVAEEEIVYQFRRRRRMSPSGVQVTAANDDEGGEWLKVA